MNTLKRIYDSISFENAVIAAVISFSVMIAALFSMWVSDNKKQEMNDQNFFDKCATACYPNSVYSTKYKRCECNASIIVKNVQE
jgi:hypothetical protein